MTLPWRYISRTGAWCVLLTIATVATATSPVELTTEAPTDSVTVGERIHIHYIATYPETLTLLPVENIDPGNCRVLSLTWQSDEKGTGKVRRADLTAITTDLEQAYLPPLPLRFVSEGGDTVTAWTDAVTVPIRSLTGEAGERQPLKPQWEAPRDWSFLLPVAAGIVALVLGWWLWRRRRRIVVVAPPAPGLPADYVALETLQRVEALGLLDRGDYKQYYSEVVDAIRHYLEERFAVQAMDRTTREIVGDLRMLRVEIEGLEPLLEEADLVKFARFVPDNSAARRVVERARDIVVRTAPKAKVAGE